MSLPWRTPMDACSFLCLLSYCAFANAVVHSAGRGPSINQNEISSVLKVNKTVPLLRGSLSRWHNGAQASSSQQKNSSYVLKLNNNGNMEYWGDFTFGKQTLPAIYDTGSFEVITISTLCKSCSRDGTVYNPKASSSFDPGEDDYIVHHFASGPVLGSKGEETLRIGDLESPLVAKSMPFWEVVRHEISAWETSEFVAIVGLGFGDKVPVLDPKKKNVTRDDTLLHRLHVNEFSICLGRGNYAPGLLGFGPEIASMKTQDFFTPIPVVGKVHWGVKMTKWGPGDFNPCDPSCGALIDSGTSFIALSPKALEAMSGLINQIQRDCSNLDKLPDLTFDLGGHDFRLPPSAYVLEVEFGNARQVSLLGEATQRNLSDVRAQGLARVCVAAFRELDVKTQFGPMMILGMPFLRHFYTIFDRGAKKIYTAPSSESCSPLKGESFLLKNKQPDKERTREIGQQRSKLDVLPTPVDLARARLRSGLLGPSMPLWTEL